MKRYLQMIAMLPFYVPATILAVIAGFIGGRTWHVKISLSEHSPDMALAETNIKIRHIK